MARPGHRYAARPLRWWRVTLYYQSMGDGREATAEFRVQAPSAVKALELVGEQPAIDALNPYRVTVVEDRSETIPAPGDGGR